MYLPSGLGSTAVTAGHFAIPGGNSPQSRTVLYGVGRSLRGVFGSPIFVRSAPAGVSALENATCAERPSAAATPPTSRHFLMFAICVSIPSGQRKRDVFARI